MTSSDLHFASTVVTGPTSEPISLALAKQWLWVDLTTDDTVIAGLIQSARVRLETDTGVRLRPQTLDVFPSEWPSDELVLPHGPLISVTSITATLTDGTASTIGTTAYQADTASLPPRIARTGAGWPANPRAVQPYAIRAVFGYADQASVNVSGITQAAGVATVTTATAHGQTTGALVTLAGATQAAYNGQHEIIVTGATTFTFLVDSATVSPATGTITMVAQTIPAPLLLALRVLLKAFYERAEVPEAYAWLIAPYRLGGLFA